MKKATAIYARQSVDKKESISIEGQIEFCKKSLFGVDDSEIKIFQDKGYSGKNTERPALKTLIEEIKSGLIEKVVVYKLDRISRNITDFYKLYEIMESNKCDFSSASETFDTSNSMGKAMMGILAIFAQMERENIQKRVKDNYYYRIAENGTWPGGPAPYGFANGKDDKGRPTLIPIEEEIEAVKEMFALYNGVSHMSLRQVAKCLNDKKLKPHKRAVFDSVTVSKILQNPIYAKADKYLYAFFKTRKINFLNPKKKWDGTHSCHIVGKKVGNANIRSYTTMEEQSVYITNIVGFIPSALYIDVQGRLSENEQFARNTDGTGRLEELGGKLKCKKCGRAIKSYYVSVDSIPTINCYGHSYLHDCDADISKVDFVDLQQSIGREIQKQLDGLHNQYDKQKKKVEKMTTEMESKKKKVNNILSAFDGDETTKKAIFDTVKTLQEEVDNLELEIYKAHYSAGMLKTYIENNPAIEVLLTCGMKYKELGWEEKREVVQVLIDKIYLTEDINTYEIVWNF